MSLVTAIVLAFVVAMLRRFVRLRVVAKLFESVKLTLLLEVFVRLIFIVLLIEPAIFLTEVLVLETEKALAMLEAAILLFTTTLANSPLMRIVLAMLKFQLLTEVRDLVNEKVLLILLAVVLLEVFVLDAAKMFASVVLIVRTEVLTLAKATELALEELKFLERILTLLTANAFEIELEKALDIGPLRRVIMVLGS